MASPLTVLHLIDTGGPGGAETILLNVVTGLDPARWRSVPVVPEVNWLYDALRASGVEPVLQSNLDGRAYLFTVHQLLRRHRASLIHAHLLGSGVYGTLAGAPLGVPVVCTFHGQSDISERERFLRIKLRILSRSRNRFVFVSEHLKRDIVGRYPLPAAGIRVVHNGIDPTTPTPTGREREEMGVSDGSRVIGALGNVREAKDYATLLRAAAIVRDRGLPARWVVLGHGSERQMEDLLALRRELALEDHVSFLGFRQDARRLLTGLDVFVSSSSTEGFSLSTVEALWVGKPVVATRSGGPEEIVRDGETALLVPTRSPAALADGVERLLRDPALARRLGEDGKRHVRQRFSRERMVANYEEVYREALDARRSRSQLRASLAAG
jgi:glycosyltransferase involved in cell wall biosynthesis